MTIAGKIFWTGVVFFIVIIIIIGIITDGFLYSDFDEDLFDDEELGDKVHKILMVSLASSGGAIVLSILLKIWVV